MATTVKLKGKFGEVEISCVDLTVPIANGNYDRYDTAKALLPEVINEAVRAYKELEPS